MYVIYRYFWFNKLIIAHGNKISNWFGLFHYFLYNFFFIIIFFFNTIAATFSKRPIYNLYLSSSYSLHNNNPNHFALDEFFFP